VLEASSQCDDVRGDGTLKRWPGGGVQVTGDMNLRTDSVVNWDPG
jgi:hypothetical protein